MFDKLKILAEKYQTLLTKMSDPQVLSNAKLIAEYSKEITNLEPVIKKYEAYQLNLAEIDDATEMLKAEADPQMRKMMDETIQTSKENLVTIEQELKILLLPKDENDDKNVIVEIRGAAGGDEANIFAGDLYRMYLKYAEIVKWKIEIIDEIASDTGGFSLIAFKVKGKNVYSKLKFETGSHRVQRVPQTESQGRVHTSTATVLVMPEIDVIEVDLKDADIKVDTYRASGAGGQHVNTTDSAVRMTHLPTGIVSSSQAERSQIKNREHALKMLKIKVYDHYKNEQLQKVSQNRKLKLGSGDRSEKIRTYNYPQNRVTDHRISFTLNKLDQVMEGKLDEIIIALHNFDQAEKLQNIDQ